MKAAPVLRAVASFGLEQKLLHTGQHYDPSMSGVFFRDLGLPEPDVNLGVGSGSHASQTAALMVGLEGALVSLEPSLVVVYGDVNSTLAAALVSSKLGLPVAHVEAGLRSFDDTMPEEINRRVTDLLSDLLFATSPEAIANLAAVGVPRDRIHFVGNPMIDTLFDNLDKFDAQTLGRRLALPGRYAVVTMHRPANVDTRAGAAKVVTMVKSLSTLLPVIFPLHPRGRASLAASGLETSQRLQVIDPLGYVDFMSLVRGAAIVVTDSGGIQEETTVLRVPCLTVRPNTERPITISQGTNQLVEPDEVATTAAEVLAQGSPRSRELPPLWDGRAGPRIASVVADWLPRRR